jgi:Resolvase, N terminal domain
VVLRRDEAEAREALAVHLVEIGAVTNTIEAFRIVNAAGITALGARLASTKRFAYYGRLSTPDKQDPALSFPSQRKACERKATELGGEISCEFTDQESGAKAERPGWTALTAEARDAASRRFDGVIIYSTSRLARDRLHAALFERELRKVGVAIHYATGGGDPETPRRQPDNRHAAALG